MSTTLSGFLRATRHGGPAVAVTTEPVILSPELAHTVVMCQLDGSHLRSRNALLRSYGEQWRFPAYFWPSWDSFNDCLGDLDGQVPPQRTRTGTVPGGFLTVVNRAEELLADAPADDFGYFAHQQGELRDLYRIPNAYGADRPHPVEFGLVLRTDAHHLNSVRRRWTAAGAEPVVLRPEEKD